MAKTKFEPREGWWFSAGPVDKVVLPHGDGRQVIDGKVLSVKGKLVICMNALHGCFDPFDALKYARGSVLHKVLFTGSRIEEDDKTGSRSRTTIMRRDAEAMLRHFARRQALTVAGNWTMPDIVRVYLETGNEALRSVAESAAWSAAESAAWSAAGAAASAARAAGSAAESAAWSAAESAAQTATWNAARSAAENAAWNAARNATVSAARSAAESAARQMFNGMVSELFSAALA